MLNYGKSVYQTGRKLPNIFSSLSKEEQNTFGEYLERIIKYLEEEAGSMPRELDEQYEITGTSIDEDRIALLLERGVSAEDIENRAKAMRGILGGSSEEGKGSSIFDLIFRR